MSPALLCLRKRHRYEKKYEVLLNYLTDWCNPVCSRFTKALAWKLEPLREAHAITIAAEPPIGQRPGFELDLIFGRFDAVQLPRWGKKRNRCWIA